MVAAYARPGVEAQALELQDRFGQDVVFLMWAAWAAPEPATLSEGAALARAWREAVTAPIRAVRRTLKSGPESVGEAARLALRRSVQGVELDAERVLAEALEALAGEGEGDSAAAVASAAGVFGGAAPADLLAGFVAGLSLPRGAC